MSPSRFRYILLAAGLLFSATVLARNISEVFLSECGINCYETSCNSTTDLACVCTDAGFNDTIQQCLLDTCPNVTDLYTSYRKLYYDCNVPRPTWTVDPKYLEMGIIVFLIQTFFFGLRMAARWLGLGKWGLDDTACGVAYFMLIGDFAMCVLSEHYGYYRNYWTLDFENLPPFLKNDFARVEIYAICLGVCKSSIIFLYQRLFEGPRLRWVLWATQTFNAALALSYFIATFFDARPLSCEFVVEVPAGCIFSDVWDGSGAFPAVNAVFDIWLVAIPAFVVWRLQMKTGRKISVIAVFAAGILTCLIAILRFIIYRLEKNPDVSPSLNQLYNWVAYYAYYAELTSCFVIACLPAVRQLVDKKIWPVVKTGLSALSSRTWASGSRTAGGSSSGGTDKGKGHGQSSGTGGTRTTISSPLEGSFRHLAGHRLAESQKNCVLVDEEEGYAF